jgi:hypothetical protein
MSGFSPYLLLGIETDVVPEKCFNFCFTEGIMEKVMQITVMIAEVNIQVHVHMVICCLVIKVVLSVTYFHNGYKILVYVVD